MTFVETEPGTFVNESRVPSISGMAFHEDFFQFRTMGVEDGNYVRATYMASVWPGVVQREVVVLKELPVELFGNPANPMDLLATKRLEYLRARLIGAGDLRLSQETYQEGQCEIRERLLARAETTVICLRSEPWLLMGFAIVERTEGHLILHYVYVKKLYRQFGLASRLLLELAGERRSIVATHRTWGWDCLAHVFRRRKFTLSYNPYLAWM